MPQNLNRLLARPLTRLLLQTRLSANQVTFLSLAVGLTAGPLFAQQQYALNIAGALLFQLYYLLDNCDGEIARLKNQRSSFGGWFDITTDAVVHTSLYLWLALWTKNTHPELTHISLAALAGISLCHTLGLLARFKGFTIALNPTAWKESTGPSGLRQQIRLNLDNENFSLLLLAVIFFDLKIPFLLATAIGANFFWIWILWVHRKKFFLFQST
ncbi:MAG: CDP-alcohol phosphatidyltransferase family protein [Candidatus Omnitrophica bacterium]|nr:CDP-alcohol phosphatidyltransferase family protein [Candidatus Omnitrophota bacterium]